MNKLTKSEILEWNLKMEGFTDEEINQFQKHQEEQIKLEGILKKRENLKKEEDTIENLENRIKARQRREHEQLPKMRRRRGKQNKLDEAKRMIQKNKLVEEFVDKRNSRIETITKELGHYDKNMKHSFIKFVNGKFQNTPNLGAKTPNKDIFLKEMRSESPDQESHRKACVKRQRQLSYGKWYLDPKDFHKQIGNNQREIKILRGHKQGKKSKDNRQN